MIQLTYFRLLCNTCCLLKMRLRYLTVLELTRSIIFPLIRITGLLQRLIEYICHSGLQHKASRHIAVLL